QGDQPDARHHLKKEQGQQKCHGKEQKSQQTLAFPVEPHELRVDGVVVKDPKFFQAPHKHQVKVKNANFLQFMRKILPS
ncbi:hypothetical protein RZS08_56460, partial [Arthrospira platensis SPKY1]|nr:hypothetical protein [Arthrospira platensis SPKY1]